MDQPVVSDRPTPARPGASLSTKILYGIGDIPITVTMVLFGLFVLFFYGTVMGLPGTLVGIASAVGLLLDAFIDPYIGHRSDHTHGRFGRRHGYMLAGGIAMGVCFWLLLSPPRGLSQTALFLWLLGTTLAFRFASAVYRIPYLSLGAELATDYGERTQVVAIRAQFGLAGTVAAATLSFILFFPNLEPGLDPKLNYAGYPALGAGAGILMTLTALIAVIGTWHWRQPYQAGLSSSGKVFFRGFFSALGNRSFRRVWITFTLFFLGVVLNAAVAVHYFTWYVELSDSKVLSNIQLSFYLGALAGVGLWMFLAKHADKHRLCMGSVAGTGLMLLLAVVLFGPGSLFGVGNPTPLIVGHALAGIMASGLWVLPGAMVADVVDEDCLEVGQRREGLFFGLLNFGEKLAAGGALLLAGVLLDLYVGLESAGVSSLEQVERLGVVYGVIPALLLFAAAAGLLGYRLSRTTVGEIQGRLSDGKLAAVAERGE